MGHLPDVYLCRSRWPAEGRLGRRMPRMGGEGPRQRTHFQPDWLTDDKTQTNRHADKLADTHGPVLPVTPQERSQTHSLVRARYLSRRLAVERQRDHKSLQVLTLIVPVWT